MRLQTSSAGLAIGDADNRYLRLAGGTMTGELNALSGLNTVRPYSSGLVPAGLSDPAPAFPFETEWNNAGKNWTAVRVSVTNTASGSASKLADFQIGGSTRFAITKDGNIFTSLSTQYVGNGTNSFTFGIHDGNAPAQVWRESGGLSSFGTLIDRDLIFLRNGARAAQLTASGFALGSSADVGIARESSGVVEFNSGIAGSLRDWKARRGSLSEYLDITEMSAPAAPAANTARLYVEDNGSGKTRLMVLFPTGAAQVLATEP